MPILPGLFVVRIGILTHNLVPTLTGTCVVRIGILTYGDTPLSYPLDGSF